LLPALSFPAVAAARIMANRIAGSGMLQVAVHAEYCVTGHNPVLHQVGSDTLTHSFSIVDSRAVAKSSHVTSKSQPLPYLHVSMEPQSS